MKKLKPTALVLDAGDQIHAVMLASTSPGS